jgi:hypothetical protein
MFPYDRPPAITLTTSMPVTWANINSARFAPVEAYGDLQNM